MATVTVGGAVYELGPVKVGVLRRLWPRLEKLGSDMVDSLEVMSAFVEASARGAPAGIADELTSDELRRAFTQAMEASGLAAKPPGEAPSP